MAHEDEADEGRAYFERMIAERDFSPEDESALRTMLLEPGPWFQAPHALVPPPDPWGDYLRREIKRIEDRPSSRYEWLAVAAHNHGVDPRHRP